MNSAHRIELLALGKALFEVLPKQATCQMKTLQLQVYIQNWFHEEQEDKFMEILTFSVSWEMTLDMYLSAGGWLYL